jgi:hypothetical protein
MLLLGGSLLIEDYHDNLPYHNNPHQLNLIWTLEFQPTQRLGSDLCGFVCILFVPAEFLPDKRQRFRVYTSTRRQAPTRGSRKGQQLLQVVTDYSLAF